MTEGFLMEKIKAADPLRLFLIGSALLLFVGLFQSTYTSRVMVS